jgi:hypothetical protein
MILSVGGRASGTTVSDISLQNFYLNIRRALTHPACNGDADYVEINTLAQWEEHKSKKIDTLLKVLQHHLDADNAPPLGTADGELVGPQNVAMPPPPDNTPDKIVVYCAFPSNNEFIKEVSESVIAPSSY